MTKNEQPTSVLCYGGWTNMGSTSGFQFVGISLAKADEPQNAATGTKPSPLGATKATLKSTGTYIYMNRILIFIFLLVGQFSNAQKNNIASTVWKHVTKDINTGYRISFNYPSYWKFDWAENCLCMGKPSKAPEFKEYNNTMNWGIWMEDGETYQLPSINDYKEKFHGDIYETKDTFFVAGYKATRLNYRQRNGKLFIQAIVFRVGDEVFDIENNRSDDADFRMFLKSIAIKKI